VTGGWRDALVLLAEQDRALLARGFEHLRGARGPAAEARASRGSRRCALKCPRNGAERDYLTRRLRDCEQRVDGARRSHLN